MLKNLGGKAEVVLVGGKMAEQIRTDNPLPFEVVLPVDVVAAREFAADPRRKSCLRRAPRGLAGARHRPETRELFAQHIAGKHDLLERADGRLRVAALQRGTKAVAEASHHPTPTRSSAALTPREHSASLASPTRFPGSRPAAVRHSSSSRARSFPASR